MAEHIFDTFREASEFARQCSIQSKCVTKIARNGQSWIVDSQTHVISSEIKSDYRPLLGRISEVLKVEDNVDYLTFFIKDELKTFEFLDVNDLDIDDETKGELNHYRYALDVLTRFSDGLGDIADDKSGRKSVRSKEYALEMSYEFNEISQELSGYKVATLAKFYATNMLELSINLPSEFVAKADTNLTSLISQLERDKGICKCGGKWKLKQSTYGYFWGCSNFPKCWSRQKLSNEEDGFLNKYER